MARPLRYEHEGALWHVTSRGNDKKAIFFDDLDRKNFLERLARTAEVYGWIIHAYVLMTNHVHLMIETPRPTLSDGMKWLNSCHAMDINRRHGRSGHLFGERFKAFLVEKETYYYEVARYIVLNPVRAGMSVEGERIAHPGAWPWSSYRATAGLEPPPPWLAVDKVWLAFSQTTDVAQSEYRRFVDAKLDAPSPFTNVVGQLFLGSRTFIARIRDAIDGRGLSDAYPREQREVGRASVAQVARVVCSVTGETSGMAVLKERRIGAERLLAAWLARLQGAKLRPIATILGVTSLGHVSSLVRRCAEEVARDPRLLELARECLARIREALPPKWAPPGLHPALA